MSCFGPTPCAKILTEMVGKLTPQDRSKLTKAYSKYMVVGWAIMDIRDEKIRHWVRTMVKHEAKHTIFNDIRLLSKDADELKKRLYYCIRESLDSMVLE